MLDHILMTIHSIALGALALFVATHLVRRYDSALTLLKARL
jgi:hypothetical protein